MPYTNREDQRVASALHYQSNKELMKARAKANLKLTRLRNREYVDSQKVGPCLDCGVSYPPYVMQYDHVRGEKLFNLGDAVNRGVSLTRLSEEIEKCELVCANCHAERTYRRTHEVR